LLVVPALAIDLAMQRIGRGHDWLLSAVIALAFVAFFFAAQWPFADFLMSPWARNALFVADRMDYGVSPLHQANFFTLNKPDNLAFGLPIAVVLAFVSWRCGLWGGNS